MPTPSKAKRANSMPLGLASLTQTVQAVSGLQDANEILLEGWLLKKRRKRMQGFARRYFVLRRSGFLSYSFEPNATTRDQILITDASLSSSASRKDIHIDSGSATFHIKCIKSEDFDLWMTAFRKFVGGDPLTRKASLGRTMSVSVGRAARAGLVLQEMGKTIQDLENTVAALRSEESLRKVPNPKAKKEKDKESKEKGEGIFGVFARSKGSQVPTPPGSNSDIKFTPSTPPPVPLSPLPYSSEYSFDRLEPLLHALRGQYRTLLQAFPSITSLEGAGVTRTTVPIVEENEEAHTEAIVLHDPQTTRGDPVSLSLTIEHPRRYSTVSLSASTSGGSLQWFDAADGGEEFILDDDGEKAVDLDNTGMVSEVDVSDHESVSGSRPESPKGHTSVSPEEYLTPQPSHMLVQRRTILPAPISGDEISLFSVLKKNVGKDLATVSLPVTFNEPLSLLQRLGEDVEYYRLLDEAVTCMDPVEKICLVTAFAVSGYACTRFRSGRKPFNPMLGETFEDTRVRFIAEKVCHNPVVLAMHAEGLGWEYWGTSGGKNKFWGKSLEIIPVGTTHVKIGQDHYQWQKPSSFMRNLIAGNKYLEHVGPMSIVNVTTGMRCDLEFKEAGFWGGSPNVVSGVVISPSGKTEARLEGTWHEQFSIALSPSHLRVLWRANPFPQHAREYYGFTAWATTLNEITPDLEGKLPATDSRLRPDQRALENGNVDEAESYKIKVEEGQRERRKRYGEVQPRWFKQVGDGAEGQDWEYVGGYWETRRTGWKDIPKLW